MQASGCGGGWGGTSQRKYVIVLISSRSFLQKGIGSLELLVWCFQKELNYLFGVSEKVLNYLFGVSQKSRVCATDNEFTRIENCAI
jgi:hypothetical protein